MEASPLHIGFALVVLAALGLFLRALMRGSRMIGGFMDKRTAPLRAAQHEAVRAMRDLPRQPGR